MIRIKANVLIIVALVVGTFALYGRTYHFDYINFDDSDYIADNSHVKSGFSADGIRWAFTTNVAANWHPATWLSLMLDGQLHGGKPGPTHLHNVILHAANAVLLFVWLLQLTGARWVSAWVAAMFAWHPLHVESVAWVSERKDVLSTLFLLLCLLAWLRYVRRATIGSYLVSLAFLGLGLMSKPMLVTVPGILFLLDFWPRNRLADSQVASPALGQKKKLTSLILEKLPFIALVAACAVVTYVVQSSTHAVSKLTVGQRLANVAISYPRYLWLTIAPRGLSVFYPMPYYVIGRTITAWQVVGGLCVMLAITLLAIALRRRAPAMLWGWLWYVGALVPVIGFISVGAQSHADRYTYIPLIGIFVGVGFFAWTLARKNRVARTSIAAIGIALLLAAAAITWRQIGFWRDSRTAMQRCIDVDPENYAGHRGLGLVFDVEGNIPAAMQKYNDALQFNPRDSLALQQLAKLTMDAGNIEEAIKLYRRAMFADPYFGPVYNNYANLLIKQGKTEDAIKVYRSGIKHDPECSANYQNLGLTLAQQGQIDEAISLWQTAVRVDPDYADAHASLGAALILKSKTREGISELRAALKIKPDRVDVLNQLAWTLAVHPSPLYRDPVEAEKLARRAIDKTGGTDPRAFDGLAAALAQQKKFDDAIEAAGRGAEIAEAQHTEDGDQLAAQIRKRIGLYRLHQPFTSGM